jgi:hypothetical protein
MKRRDFAIGFLLLGTARSVRSQNRAKQHRIAIVIPAGPVAIINETSSDALNRRLYQPFFEELRRLGDIEGQNLIVERYSGEGRPEGYPDLAREVAGRNPEVSNRGRGDGSNLRDVDYRYERRPATQQQVAGLLGQDTFRARGRPYRWGVCYCWPVFRSDLSNVRSG